MVTIEQFFETVTQRYKDWFFSSNEPQLALENDFEKTKVSMVFIRGISGELEELSMPCQINVAPNNPTIQNLFFYYLIPGSSTGSNEELLSFPYLEEVEDDHPSLDCVLRFFSDEWEMHSTLGREESRRSNAPIRMREACRIM